MADPENAAATVLSFCSSSDLGSAPVMLRAFASTISSEVPVR
jgi:hypothetical protein